MNSNESPSMSNIQKSIFDQYAFDTRSPQSDFDSLTGSRRQSAQANTSSPSTRFSPMMRSIMDHDQSSTTDHNLGDSTLLSETQSIRSNTSSLRDAYAALKGGIFPPGLSSKRPSMQDSDDEGSDGSHYDEDGYSFEGDGPFQKPDSPVKVSHESAFAAANKVKSLQEDIYCNAPDSPDVPMRRSSVLSSQPVTATNSRNSEMENGQSSTWHEINLSKEGEPSQTKISEEEEYNSPSLFDSKSRKQSTHVRSQPSIGESTDEALNQNLSSLSIKAISPKATTEANLTPGVPNVERRESAAKEEEWQKQHEIAMASDPNRPRTLKEARALAKERARLRNQARVGPGESLSPDPTSPPSATTISHQSSGSTSETRSPTNESQQRQDHRHAQIIPLSSETQSGTAVVTTYSADDSKKEEVEGMQEGKQNLPEIDRTFVDMSDLQAAVGEALEDVSFTSSATSTTATATGKGVNTERTPIMTERSFSRRSSNAAQNLPPPPPNVPLSVPSDIDVESMTHSVTSFDSARESPTSHASPYVSAANLPGSPIGAPENSEEVQPPTIPVIQAADHFRQPSAFAYAASQGTYDAATVKQHQQQQQQNHPFVPHTLHSHQRSTAPNKIARLDVYGKSIAWPAAFEPAAIIEQKRLAPWERARSYAHYCNDLMTTPTGIHIWLDMVQRPAQRAAAAAAAAAVNSTQGGFPSKRHLRAEGTDGSGYAASVRSDATFPMRGDGGKAKELVAHHPSEASIPESPNAVPQSLPYPILASGTSGNLVSSSSQSPLIRHQTRPSQEGFQGSSLPSSNSLPDKRDPRGFFSNLGRKSSTRKGQGQGIGFSSFSASNNSPSKSNIRSRGISVPAPTGNSPNMKTIPIVGSQSLDQSVPSPLKPSPSPSMIPSFDSSNNTHDSPKLMKSMDSSNNLASSTSRNGPQGPRALGNSPSYLSSLSSARTNSTSNTRNDSIPSIHQSSNDQDNSRVGLHGLSPTGGIYSIPANSSSNSHLNAPTDYSSNSSPSNNSMVDKRSPRGNAPTLPALTNVKQSLSYQSVKDPNRRPKLQPPIKSTSSAHSSDSHSSSVLETGGGGGNGNNSFNNNNNMSNTLSASNGGGGGIARTLGRRRSSNLVHAMTAEESEALDKLCDVLPDGDRMVLLEYLRRANGNDLAAIGDYLQDQSKAEQSRHMR